MVTRGDKRMHFSAAAVEVATEAPPRVTTARLPVPPSEEPTQTSSASIIIYMLYIAVVKNTPVFFLAIGAKTTRGGRDTAPRGK